VRTQPFLDTWQHPHYVMLRTQSIDHDCPECTANRSLSPGGCRATAYAFTGRWDAPDPFCGHMGQGIDVSQRPGAL
jgi:radical SAM protein with 4Fe4S-binding SPASM domain